MHLRVVLVVVHIRYVQMGGGIFATSILERVAVGNAGKF